MENGRFECTRTRGAKMHPTVLPAILDLLLTTLLSNIWSTYL